MTSRRIGRRGVALPVVVIFLFVLLGLAALTIDAKLAFVIHGRLRTIADAAALEGLRFGGLSPAMLREETESGAFDGRLAARLDADVLERYRELAGERPSESYDPAAPSAEWLAWLERASDVLARLQAERTVRGSAAGLGPEVVPADEADPEDRRVADLAVRTRRPLAADGVAAIELNLPQDGVQHPQGDIVATAASLTVRLRRDGAAAVAGSISAGPRTPRLFRPSDPFAAPSWSNGFAAVAEGTAVLAPVRTVGTATPERMGAAPFCLFVPSGSISVLVGIVRDGNQLLMGELPIGHTLGSVGRVSVGDLLTGAPAVISAEGEGYVPIVGASGGPVQRFVWVSWRQTAPETWTFRHVGRIAPENASAIVRGSNDPGTTIPAGPDVLQAPVRGKAP